MAVNVTAWPSVEGCARIQRRGRCFQSRRCHRLSGERSAAGAGVRIAAVRSRDRVRSGRKRRGGELGLVAAADECEDTGVCAWPSTVKVTVPVGVPWKHGAATTAVNVTAWPSVEGLCDDSSVVVDAFKAGALTV